MLCQLNLSLSLKTPNSNALKISITRSRICHGKQLLLKFGFMQDSNGWNVCRWSIRQWHKNICREKKTLETDVEHNAPFVNSRSHWLFPEINHLVSVSLFPMTIAYLQIVFCHMPCQMAWRCVMSLRSDPFVIAYCVSKMLTNWAPSYGHP